jgi:hypothetical protein
MSALARGRRIITEGNALPRLLDETALLARLRTEEGRKRLAETMDKAGFSSLYMAVVLYESVALKFAKTEDGMRLLAEAEGPAGWSALYMAAVLYKSVGLELAKTPEGKKLLAEARDPKGWSALRIAAELVLEDAKRERREYEEELQRERMLRCSKTRDLGSLGCRELVLHTE